MHMGSSMNKHESKYFNTAILMNEALIRSLDKKDYEYITVKEICDIAGVNRSTFYLHYETMEDLLLETIESMFNDLKNRYTSDFVTEKIIDSKNMDSMKLFTREYSIPYLSFLKEHKKAFMVAINHQALFKVESIFNALYKTLFEPILSRFKVSNEEKKYVIAYFMSGIHAIIIEWIKGNCEDDINLIADIIYKYVNR